LPCSAMEMPSYRWLFSIVMRGSLRWQVAGYMRLRRDAMSVIYSLPAHTMFSNDAPMFSRHARCCYDDEYATAFRERYVADVEDERVA